MSLASGTAFVNSDATGKLIPYSDGGFPNGVANSLTWTSTGLNSTYVGTISVPGVSTKTSVQATLAVNPTGGDFSDAVNCWLVSAYCGAGSINFIVAGNPASPTRFPIVWAVVDNYNV